MPRTAAKPNAAADWLAALGEPTRLAAVRILATGTQSVTVLARDCKTEMVNISHHLKIMKHAGLVEVERDGRFMYYSLVGAKAVAGGIELAHPAGVRVFIALG